MIAKNSTSRRMLRLVAPYWRRLALAVLCMAGVAFCAVVPPWLMKNTVDDVLISRRGDLLNYIAAAIVAFFILKNICAYWQKYLMNWVGQRVVLNLRQDSYAHLQTLSFRYINARNVGELLSRVTNDANVLQTTVSGVLVDLVVHGLSCVGMIGYLFYLNWRLMAYTVVILPFVVVVLDKTSKRLRRVGRKTQEHVAGLTAVAEEVLGAIRIVRAFATEPQELDRFEEANEENFKVVMKGVRLNALLTGCVEVFLILALSVILWIGGKAVIAGRMSPGELVAFLGTMGFLASPINAFTRAVSQLQFGVAAAERIFELLDNDDRIVSPPDAVDPGRVTGKVDFENVWFSYVEEQPVLRGLDLHVRPGEKLAIVGSTGAGKSTLVDLVQRFYDPQSGQVLIDGRDVRTLKLDCLRRQIGVVPQDPILMKGTIRSNITYGYDGTDEEVKTAARMAGIDAFIESLPDGYDSPVGPRGVTLSGGQRQRVAIARAVIRDPRILILDEATSSLDAAVELRIQEAMEAAMRGRTSFIIAHRLSTIRSADRIVFLSDGRIIESGTHDQLIALNGGYQKLFALQYGHNR
ncbi:MULTISPECIES: ABC transporter ATP-binding protein [Jonquetella]|uniref:ABC transporter ATP-binding protein n=1 Tax=Jonquetella TaxID=428711 RepID=UPI0003AD8518|nr:MULTISPECIES: ABC transporter ATP-binding protein [Jonquetella]ERL23734.1 ABC transporter transmembrane region [Jonquetella sp. BV3C21]